MSIGETIRILLDDIDNFRLKADYYESLHLAEASGYARDLASSIELALTTLPSEDDHGIC